MVSSMRCCKSRLIDWGRAALLGVLLLLAGWVQASGELGGVQLRDFSLQNSVDGIHLSAQLDIALSPTMSDALQKGVPLYFVAQASVLKARWYWRDDLQAQTKRYMRLVYQPLTRRWRLNTSASPLVSSGLGVSLSQHFESLEDALHAMGRMAHWQISPAEPKAASPDYRVVFEFGIDIQQLPRPFVIGQSGGLDWALKLTHESPIPSETP